jgi:hypothetical protein
MAGAAAASELVVALEVEIQRRNGADVVTSADLLRTVSIATSRAKGPADRPAAVDPETEEAQEEVDGPASGENGNEVEPGPEEIEQTEQTPARSTAGPARPRKNSTPRWKTTGATPPPRPRLPRTEGSHRTREQLGLLLLLLLLLLLPLPLSTTTLT